MPSNASFIRVDDDVADGLARDRDRLARVLRGDLKVGKRVDIGHAWDGLHYLLSLRRRAGAVRDTGDVFGLGLFGGRSLNAYVLDSEQVVRVVDSGGVGRIDDAMQDIGGGQLDAAYRPAEMDRADVEPGDWQQRGDEGFEFLLDAFLTWRELYHRAAEDGQCVICLMEPNSED